MKIGSVVQLSRPYSGNESYRDEIGVVTNIRISHTEPRQEVCVIRFTMLVMDANYPDELMVHHSLEIYKHRLDLLKE